VTSPTIADTTFNAHGVSVQHFYAVSQNLNINEWMET